ncbi:MAG TPA: hypothetical protein VFB33_01685 [Candidatus Binataceae bacterium]|nr:hypothetical protein [Candidatus Binataceae bacterium]
MNRLARQTAAASIVALTTAAVCALVILPSASRAPAAGVDLHFRTLPPHAALPSGQYCAAAIPPSPETRPQNIPFNHTEPAVSQLLNFYKHPVFGSNPPASDFFLVDGHYQGSTDMILRWAACKWGIDEDVMRAQAWTESKWRQGGPNPGDGGGDKRTLRSQCVQGAFTALWNLGCPGCCYQSWGILQTKVYYAWGTWPMIKDSTAFNADYRGADQRACMNGDYASYFASAAQQPNTYAADIASGDLARILWGCIGMHYSGGWYTPSSLPYIRETQGYLTTKPWTALRPTSP